MKWLWVFVNLEEAIDLMKIKEMMVTTENCLKDMETDKWRLFFNPYFKHKYFKFVS